MKPGVLRKAPILRELALAATAGLVFAVSPFTPNELPHAAALGLLLGVGVLAWRLRPGSPLWREAPAVPVRLERAHWLAGLTGLLCLAVFAPTLQWMYLEWTRSVWSNEHGILVPFAMAWMARNALRGDDGPPETSAWGFVPLVSGLALAVVDASAQTRYVAAVGLLLTLLGLSLLLLGARRTRILRVPLLLGILLIPIPYTLGTPLVLRTITASGVLPLLHLLDMAAVREGTLLVLPRQSFLVADACSGVATLYASLAVALVLAALSASLWRRIVLITVAPLLAIGANVVRVTILVLIGELLGASLLDTALHEASGVATFLVVLVTLIFIAGRGNRGAA